MGPSLAGVGSTHGRRPEYRRVAASRVCVVVRAVVGPCCLLTAQAAQLVEVLMRSFRYKTVVTLRDPTSETCCLVTIANKHAQ